MSVIIFFYELYLYFKAVKGISCEAVSEKTSFLDYSRD